MGQKCLYFVWTIATLALIRLTASARPDSSCLPILAIANFNRNPMDHLFGPQAKLIDQGPRAQI